MGLVVSIHSDVDEYLEASGSNELLALEPLTEANWVLYAMREYFNPSCHSTDEFFEDMKRLKYVKKLLTHYERSGELKERLILNHLILLGNVLGPRGLVRLLFLKMPGQLAVLKPFLIQLNVLPKEIRGIGRDSKTYYTDDIGLDQGVIDALRKI